MISIEKYFPVDLDNPINKNHRFAKGMTAFWVGVPQLVGGSKFYDLFGFNHLNLNGNSTKPKWSHQIGPTGFFGIDFADCTNVTDNVPLPTIASNSSSWSMSCWYNGPVNAVNYCNLINDSNRNGFRCDTSKVNGMKGDSLFAGGITIAINTIYNTTQLCVSWNGTTGVFAANGAIASTNISDSAFLDGPFLGGGYHNGGGEYRGQLYDIVFWGNKALTQNEMQQFYILALNGYPGLINRVNIFANPIFASFIAQLNQRVLKGSVIRGESEEIDSYTSSIISPF